MTTYGTRHRKLTFFRRIPWLSAQTPVQYDADLPHRCHGSSAWADADSVQVYAKFSCRQVRIFRVDRHGSSVQVRVENGGDQKANFVRTNTERSENTSQGSFKLSL